MSCIDRCLRAPVRLALAGLSLLAGCSASPPTAATASASANAANTKPATKPATTQAVATSARLPPPGAVRNWSEVRLQAAKRMVAANPATTYTGAVPDPLLAIPVLEIELNADGSVRKIEIVRQPRENKDTTQLAIDAVHRAAPFGDVSRLPKPWRFTETFLFDDDRKFKPRTLDQ